MALELRPHQKANVEALWNMRYGMDLSSPGCGKTAVAIALIARAKLKTVVVVPAYLIRNWVNEFRMWAPNIKVEVFTSGQKKYSGDVIVMSYAMTGKAAKWLKAARYIVCDEAHYLSNPSSQRSKSVLSAVKAGAPERVLLMTGTILRNAVSELWLPLTICDYGNNRGFREFFKSRYTFMDTFMHREMKRIYGRLINEWKGSRNHEQLRQWIGAWSVETRIEDLTEIPPVLRIPMLIESRNDSLDTALSVAWDEFERQVIGAPNIHQIKAQNAFEKAPSTAEFVKDLLQQGIQHVVVFTDHVLAAKLMAETLSIKHDIALVTGETPAGKRSAIVDAFQDGKLKAIVATIGAMSLGVTLTKANVVVFNDKDFDPTKNQQALGRVRRISQSADKVLCYEICREGVDYRINELLAEKEMRISDIFNTYTGADCLW